MQVGTPLGAFVQLSSLRRGYDGAAVTVIDGRNHPRNPANND